MCPSTPQEDREVISEGEGNSLPPTPTGATFPGLGTSLLSPFLQPRVSCRQRG